MFSHEGQNQIDLCFAFVPTRWNRRSYCYKSQDQNIKKIWFETEGAVGSRDDIKSGYGREFTVLRLD